MARRTVFDAIVRAAGELIVDRNEPAFTFDRVADLAGVSRRTVFNYFETRDALLAAGIDAAVQAYLERMPIRGDRDIDEWLRDLVAASVEQNSERGGWYFEMLLAEQVEPLRSALRRRQVARMELSTRVADECWRGRGMPTPVPADVAVAFNVWLGAFAVAALRVDGGVAEDDMVDLVLRQLHAVLAEARRDVEQHRDRMSEAKRCGIETTA